MSCLIFLRLEMQEVVSVSSNVFLQVSTIITPTVILSVARAFTPAYSYPPTSSHSLGRQPVYKVVQLAANSFTFRHIDQNSCAFLALLRRYCGSDVLLIGLTGPIFCSANF